jgi:hypothetical protein
MERTPSIMVGGEVAKPSRTVKRRQATKPQARRTRHLQGSRVVRNLIIPRRSAIYEAEVRSINRAIIQQQQLQFEQRQQIELNLLRQEIRRSRTFPLFIPPFGCALGSLGCWKALTGTWNSRSQRRASTDMRTAEPPRTKQEVRFGAPALYAGEHVYPPLR